MVLAKILVVHALGRYEGALVGNSIVALRGHVVDTCSLPKSSRLFNGAIDVSGDEHLLQT